MKAKVFSQVLKTTYKISPYGKSLDSEDLAVHVSMLRYLFRLENDMPNYSWGLKTDLEHRMMHGHKFNPQPTKPYLEAETKKPELTGKGVLAVLEGK